MRRSLLVALIVGLLPTLRAVPPEPAEANTVPRSMRPAFALLPGKYRICDYGFERDRSLLATWGRAEYRQSAWPKIPQRAFRPEQGNAGPAIEAAIHEARQVLPMITAALYPYKLPPNPREAVEQQHLVPEFNEYANSQGAAPEQFESCIEAAKRIIAGGATARRTPDVTSRWLDQAADAILAHVGIAEAVAGSQRGPEFETTVSDLKIIAHFARFHARRAIGAVHYNLFKRSLRLGELFAATMDERKAVAAWRELVAAAGNREVSELTGGMRGTGLKGRWRDDLKQLEAGLKELEEQCCPPDEAVLRQMVWSP